MEMTVDYLPIGSIVRLEEGTKKLMITGYCTVPEETPEEVYDYCGCLYPEGVVDSEETYVFDHDQIEEVSFIGYEDDESKQFKKALIDTINEMYDDKNLEEVENTTEPTKSEEIESL